MYCVIVWRNSTTRFASLPERKTENIKHFILESRNRTHKYHIYNHTPMPLRHYGLNYFQITNLMLKYFSPFHSFNHLSWQFIKITFLAYRIFIYLSPIFFRFLCSDTPLAFVLSRHHVPFRMMVHASPQSSVYIIVSRLPCILYMVNKKLK